MSDNPKSLLKPDTPPPLPEGYDSARYRRLRNGAIIERGKPGIVANPGGGTAAFTPETSQLAHQRRRELVIVSQLRGLAAAQGIDLPADADLEQIARGAGTTIEAITKHMAQTFLASKNLRGQAESYRALLAPLLGSDDAAPNTGESVPPRIVLILAELAKRREILDADG